MSVSKMEEAPKSDLIDAHLENLILRGCISLWLVENREERARLLLKRGEERLDYRCSTPSRTINSY
jgi:hypothetical protein